MFPFFPRLFLSYFFAQQTSKCDVTQGRFSLAGCLNAPTIKKQTNAKKKKRGRFYAVADDDDRAVVVDNNIIEVLNFRLIIRTKNEEKEIKVYRNVL